MSRRQTARKATSHILAAANEPRRPAVNGVNYLMLLGRSRDWLDDDTRQL